MTKNEKKWVSAEELMGRLKSDPEYIARMDEKERRVNTLREKYKEAELPVLQDLADAGFPVDSLDELRSSGTNYKAALPVLLKWVKKIKTEDVKESIVRALSVPWARPDAARPLLIEFNRAGNAPESELKWAIGNALEVVADDSVLDDLIKMAYDQKNGTSRQMVVLALGKMKDRKRAIEALIPLLDDEQVAGHAIAALGKLKAKETRKEVERFLNHPKAWIRKEAKHALTKMR